MKEITRLRRRLAQVGPRGRGARLPEDLREEIGAYSRARVAEGGRLREIALEVGVSRESVRRWISSSRRRRARPENCDDHATAEVVPVNVVSAEITDAVVVVTATGHRVEGLDVAGAAALLRALG